MKSITVRNISDSTFERIRRLSQADKRSINSEILVIIERGTQSLEETVSDTDLSASEQANRWLNLSIVWEDERSTKEIIDEIYSDRTMGRDFAL